MQTYRRTESLYSSPCPLLPACNSWAMRALGADKSGQNIKRNNRNFRLGNIHSHTHTHGERVSNALVMTPAAEGASPTAVRLRAHAVCI